MDVVPGIEGRRVQPFVAHCRHLDAGIPDKKGFARAEVSQ